MFIKEFFTPSSPHVNQSLSQLDYSCSFSFVPCSKGILLCFISRKKVCKLNFSSQEKRTKKKDFTMTTVSAPVDIKLAEDLKFDLECPICNVIPRSGPIYQCENGHMICKVKLKPNLTLFSSF